MNRWQALPTAAASRLLPWHFATPARYGALFGESYATHGNLRGVAVWLKPGEAEMTPEAPRSRRDGPGSETTTRRKPDELSGV